MIVDVVKVSVGNVATDDVVAGVVTPVVVGVVVNVASLSLIHI